MKMNYEYALDQCDILDKANAIRFREHRLKWLEELNGQDPHSIFHQIRSMLWDYALFVLVNELRGMAEKETEHEVGFNGPVIRLFDAGFVTTQSIAIRRLIEEPQSNPKRAIISVRSILKEIKDNANLITRENYVCYDGLPYDYEAGHQQWLSMIPTTDGVHVSCMPTSGPNAWYMSELVHKSFDRLSRAVPENRKRTDQIKPEVFAFLEAQLDTCKDVKRFVDKFVAHAAAPESRLGLSQEQRGITLDRLKSCHKAIYQVAGSISGRLLYESNLGGVPVPQSDHLENLDKRWATTENLHRARRKWDEYTNEVSTWDSTSLLK